MPFEYFVSIISIIIAIIGTGFGIISYYSSKKANESIKTYEYLFKIAKESMDLNDKSEEIFNKSKELNKLETDLNTMRKAIKDSIPIEARKTVLYDRLKIEEEQLVNYYNRYMKTMLSYRQLEETSTDIPDYILNEIDFHIQPDYLIKSMRQKYLSMLTFISYTTAIISIIPVISIFARYLIVLTLYPLIRWGLLMIPKDKREMRQYLYKKILNCFLIISICILVTSAATFVGNYNYYSHYSEIYEILMLLSIILFILTLILKLYEIWRRKSKKDEND